MSEAPAAPAAAWRSMTAADVPAVMDLSGLVHPAFFEAAEMFLDRLALFPKGALVADAPGARFGIAAYALAYPAERSAPPPLDTVLGTLPPGADALYLHDVAVDPAFRGARLADPAIRRLLALADARFSQATLISIYGTVPFWSRFGFAARPGLLPPDKLASYGADAVFMVRPAGGGAAGAGTGSGALLA